LELADTLDSLDGADGYAAWILDLCEPHVHGSVLEVGAGHGTFTDLLIRPAERIVATDVSERCIGVLRERFAGHAMVTVVQGSLAEARDLGPFDTVVVINVLEHVEDDKAALKDVAANLKPGGRLVLWVPAFELLYSEFDRRIGHYRRYRVAEVRSLLEGAGLQIVEARYVNPVGWVAWLVAARLLRRNPTGKAAHVFDRYFVPTLRRLDRRFRSPFGASVFAAARLPSD
jgi:SAM-dependent methyltransferase